jgi:hypothetical protein
VETGAISTASPASQTPSPTLSVSGPKLAAAGVNSPIVSGGYLKYSRFWETATGDRVRSGPAWREPQSYGGGDLKKGLGASEIAKALKIGRASVYRALLSAP